MKASMNDKNGPIIIIRKNVARNSRNVVGRMYQIREPNPKIVFVSIKTTVICCKIACLFTNRGLTLLNSSSILCFTTVESPCQDKDMKSENEIEERQINM